MAIRWFVRSFVFLIPPNLCDASSSNSHTPTPPYQLTWIAAAASSCFSCLSQLGKEEEEEKENSAGNNSSSNKQKCTVIIIDRAGRERKNKDGLPRPTRRPAWPGCIFRYAYYSRKGRKYKA